MEENVRVIESVREVDIENGPRTGAEEYRRKGIESVQHLMSSAQEILVEAEKWTESTSAVPDHLRPLISELAHKANRIVDELKGMR